MHAYAAAQVAELPVIFFAFQVASLYRLAAGALYSVQ